MAAFLTAQGYQIVATNLRIGALELDLVARQQRVLVVVEVRTRSPKSWTSGFGSLSPSKRARIRRAGQRLWDRRYRADSSVDRLRFDAASVHFDPDGSVRIDYAVAAF